MCENKINLYIFVISFIFAVVSATSSTTTPKPNSEHKCSSVKVHGKHHIKHLIMNGLNRPYQLAMYPHNHTIFFSQNVGDDKKDTFQIGYVQINDTAPTFIDEIKNGFAVTVDESNGIAYFGSNEGIYAKNLTKSENTALIVKGYDVWDMFFHEHLYFIKYPSMRLYKYDLKSENVTLCEHIKGKIYQFAIDGKKNTFITTVEGLHMMKHGESDRIHIKGPKRFRAIEVNHAGVAHFGANNSIYVVNETGHELVEIAEIKNVFGVTFDSDDHIIYSNPLDIIKLVPGECEESHDGKDDTKKGEEKKKEVKKKNRRSIVKKKVILN